MVAIQADFSYGPRIFGEIEEVLQAYEVGILGTYVFVYVTYVFVYVYILTIHKCIIMLYMYTCMYVYTMDILHTLYTHV